MRIRSVALIAAILLGSVAAWNPALADTLVTGAGGGVYPPGTNFNGVPISGLEFALGAKIADSGSAFGGICIILLGTSAPGLQQNIRIQGDAATGQHTAANVAVYTGTCTVDMADGTTPTPGVPFTATVTTDANDEGRLRLVIGVTTLPDAVVNSGSQTIK
jgi:hypothetical protein